MPRWEIARAGRKAELDSREKAKTGEKAKTVHWSLDYYDLEG
ncbi:MAG TPA: hypothetical protein VES88_06775 [Gemmatimonadaceae bacterium]|nr:hypothetical protein [Gemmatimonadaceae bacterium]